MVRQLWRTVKWCVMLWKKTTFYPTINDATLSTSTLQQDMHTHSGKCYNLMGFIGKNVQECFVEHSKFNVMAWSPNFSASLNPLTQEFWHSLDNNNSSTVYVINVIPADSVFHCYDKSYSNEVFTQRKSADFDAGRGGFWPLCRKHQCNRYNLYM